MTNPIVKVNGLSKRYLKDNRSIESFREALTMPLRRLFRGSNRSSEESIWALKDVDFQLEKGDVLGVIGRNGAGKSTLLKILSEVTAPTSGEIIYHGELTPILEIGTGFHPDLSGRENIYLNGAVLGMGRSEIEERLPDILSFSGVEDFIDLPVKHYSSGMYLRLAFSIAFHADIDILVLDEVLAVGDAAFQRKSFDRIKELSMMGATIILASHTNRQIMELCNKCLWLESGQVKEFGTAQQVLENYLEEVFDEHQKQGKEGLLSLKGYQRTWPPPPNETTSANYSLISLKVQALNKPVDEPIYTSDIVLVEILLHKTSVSKSIEVGLFLSNAGGSPIFLDSYALRPDYEPIHTQPGIYSIRAQIPANVLYEGLYFLNLFAGVDKAYERDWQQLLKFRIQADPGKKQEEWIHQPLLKIRLSWDVSLQTS